MKKKVYILLDRDPDYSDFSHYNKVFSSLKTLLKYAEETYLKYYPNYRLKGSPWTIKDEDGHNYVGVYFTGKDYFTKENRLFFDYMHEIVTEELEFEE